MIKRLFKTKTGIAFTIMILSSLVLGLSYATFIYTTSGYKASELMISNLLYGISISGNGEGETINGTSVTVTSGSTVNLNIKITNLNSIDSNYGLDYKITSGTGNVYYLDSTEYMPTGSINKYGNQTYEKTIKVVIVSTSNMTVKFNVSGGYTHNSNVGVTSGYTRVSQVYVIPDITGNQIKLADTLQSQMPSFNTYNGKLEAVVECSNSTGKFNYNDWTLDISNIGKDAECNLTFNNKSLNKTYLNDYIISLNDTTQGDGEVVKETATVDNSTFTAGNKLSQSSYANLSNDATYPYTWNDTDKTWTSSNHTDSTTSTMSFNVSSSGYYQICYMQQSEKNYDYASIKKDNTEIKSLKGISNTTYECYYLGNLTTSNVITISYKKDGSSSTQPDNVVFYLQSGTYNQNIQSVSAGYRYEGSNPNNYILYNGELWRIIGVFDSTTHGISENLVKIIRNDSIGGLAYSTAKGINSWGESTLYKLLNQTSGGSYYTGVDYINKESGTYCSSYHGYTPSDCSFSKTGIRSDYAREMIEKTKWYSTAYNIIGTAPDTYIKDITTTTSTEGYIGLMYLSDYEYAVKASDCARTIKLDSYYGTYGLICAGKNWLKSGHNEWLLSRTDTSASWLLDGNFLCSNVDDGYAVRPSLYLKSSVYYVSGSGTYDNPIIVGN